MSRDGEGNCSYLLLTMHKQPLSSIRNMGVIKDALMKWTKVYVNEHLYERPYDTIINLNGITELGQETLPEKYFQNLSAEYLAMAKLLKPWVIYTLFQFEKCMQPQGSGVISMDIELMKLADENNKPIMGLETQTEMVQMMGLDKLSRSKVMELLDNEERQEEQFHPTLESPLEQVYLNGDLLSLSEIIRNDIQEGDSFLSASLKSRNTTWARRMVDYHNKNKGNVFFAVGAAHGVTEIGLLSTLKDDFKIFRLDEDGTFRPFVYIPIALILERVLT